MDERSGRYSVGGRCAALPAVTQSPLGVLWNPHATKDIYVVSLSCFRSTLGAASQYIWLRTTTRGTPGSTVTPDIDNDVERLLAPISGAVLDLAAYTVEPTKVGDPASHQIVPSTAIGDGQELFFNSPIRVPAGTGLATVQAGATGGRICDIAFSWDE